MGKYNLGDKVMCIKDDRNVEIKIGDIGYIDSILEIDYASDGWFRLRVTWRPGIRYYYNNYNIHHIMHVPKLTKKEEEFIKLLYR